MQTGCFVIKDSSASTFPSPASWYYNNAGSSCKIWTRI